MNAVLAMIVVAFACVATLVLLSPCQMRAVADWLNARADACDWNRKRHAEYKTHREQLRPKSQLEQES